MAPRRRGQVDTPPNDAQESAPNTLEADRLPACEPPGPGIVTVVATPAEEGDFVEEIVEVYANPTQEALPGRAGGKGGIRCAWTEARLLSLLQTASSFGYASIRFNGMNLQHGKKGKTMKQIRSALQTDPVLWPQVPVDLTLDLWLDNAVADYLKKRGKRGNKDNTGEGDDPDVGARSSAYADPAVEAELACYVRQGMEKNDEIDLNEMNRRDEEEICREMMSAAMQSSRQKGQRKRPSSSASNPRSRSRSAVEEDESEEEGDASHMTRKESNDALVRSVRMASKALAEKAKADVANASANAVNAQANLLNAQAASKLSEQMFSVLQQQMELLAAQKGKK